jgi:hypothetical protein
VARQNLYLIKNNAGFANGCNARLSIACTTTNVTEVYYLKLPEAKKLKTGKLIIYFSIRTG